jgi:hypothetical protein
VIVSCVCLGKGDSSRAVGQAILIQAQLNQTNDKDAKECKTTKTITKNSLLLLSAWSVGLLVKGPV